MRYKIADSIEDLLGNKLSSATITVYLCETTTLATIYAAKSGGTALVGSQTTTNSRGYFECFVDSADYDISQRFKIKVEKTGYTTFEVDNIEAFRFTDLALVAHNNDGTHKTGLTLDKPVFTSHPSFLAYRSTTQTGVGPTATKIQFDGEIFDTNSNYDPTTNYRFTPTVAGKYSLSTVILFEPNGVANIAAIASIRRNGSDYAVARCVSNPSGNYFSIVVSTIADANGTTDYFEVFLTHTDTPSKIVYSGANQTYFTGCRVG